MYKLSLIHISNQISKDIKNKRAKELKEIMEKKRAEFLDKMIGTTQYVLIEKKLQNKKYEGYSENYIYVELESEKDIFNKIVKVKITGKNDTHLKGEIL